MFGKEQSVRSFASPVVKVSDKMSQPPGLRRLRQRGGGSGAGGSNEGQAAAAAEADEEDVLDGLHVGQAELDEVAAYALEATTTAAPGQEVCVTVAFELWRQRTSKKAIFFHHLVSVIHARQQHPEDVYHRCSDVCFTCIVRARHSELIVDFYVRPDKNRKFSNQSTFFLSRRFVVLTTRLAPSCHTHGQTEAEPDTKGQGAFHERARETLGGRCVLAPLASNFFFVDETLGCFLGGPVSDRSCSGEIWSQASRGRRPYKPLPELSPFLLTR